MKRLVSLPLLLLAACSAPRRLQVEIKNTQLLADGYDQTSILIAGPTRPPRLSFEGDSHYSRLTQPVQHAGQWRATLTTSIDPGVVTLVIRAPGYKAISRRVTLLAETSDSASDGTPDFLRLEDDSDRAAFRRWFTFLAEVQYFIPPAQRSVEISDCSALLRYAYREALHNHDAAWSAGAHLPLLPAIPSIEKYALPHAPLGNAVFRTRAGTYSPADVRPSAFSEFAPAESLQRFNTYFISRDMARAVPGDLLFFRRSTNRFPYHSMIFVGPSQINRDSQIYVVYHTGPEGTNAGDIRRLTVNQLLHFPDPQWQPIAANPSFLGIFRWNILKATS